MTKAHSRNLRGLDYDPREAARAAARRSGKSLGDWLDDAIREKAENAIDEETEFEDAGRIDAVARRLARSRQESQAPRGRREDYDQPRRWRDEAEDQRDAYGQSRPAHDEDEDEDQRRARRGRNGRDFRSDRGRETREEFPRRSREEPPFDPNAIIADAADIVERRVSETERHTARAFQNLAGLIKKTQREGEGKAVKRAVEAFAQRAEESERQTARALNDIAGLLENGQRGRETSEEGLAFLAERLGRIESRLTEQPAVNSSVRPIRTALARLETRLDRLAGDDRAQDVEQALSGLDKRLADIAAKLEDDARRREATLVAAPPPAPVPTPVAAATMDGSSAAAVDEGLRRHEPSTRRPLVDAIAEITQRQRVLDAPEPAPPPAYDLWEGEPPAKRFASLNQTLEALSQQLDTVRQDAGERVDQQMIVMRQVEGLRREMEDMSRALGDLAPRASIASVETALRDLAHRVDAQRYRGVADELLAPAERIAGELRAVIKDLDPSPIVRNLHADVQTIGRRLDAMQAPGGADASAIEALAAQTREIKEQLAALASRPLPLEKIETRLFDLTHRVDALGLASPGAGKAAAALDMGELVRSIRSIVTAETGNSFETFNHRLEQLAGKLDDAIARSGAKRFDELDQRIDALGKTLSQRIDNSARAIETAPLENLIASLAKKIDSALDQKPHGAGFEEIGRKIERLETRFANPPAGAASEQFTELAQRIDLVHKTLAQRLDSGSSPEQAADVRYIEELVRGLDQKVENALGAGAKGPDLSSIEYELAQLSRKVERLEDPSANPKLGAFLARPMSSPQLDDITQRLERMQSALTHRAEESARAESRHNDLAGLVEQLAARMNQALDPRGDASALKSLESQIGALSQRLDRSDQNGSALAAIETRIGALVAQMEDARASTTQLAEEAVRRATAEVLRQASPAPGALREALDRELTDIRKIHDESGQRTHETLLAVHETLERVVDRLAQFEDELSDIRSAPESTTAPTHLAPAHLAPAQLAPTVGPAPRREAPAPRPASAPEPAVEPRAPRIETTEDDDLTDFLVPPGGPVPSRREPELSTPFEDRARGGVQSDFIAAARRAAQQAAMDAEVAAKAQQSRRAAGLKAEAPSSAAPRMAGGLASAINDRKRPLLLGLGALVLLIGAYQIARVSIEGGELPGPTAHHHETEAAPGDSDGAPAAEADAPPATANAPEAATVPATPAPAPAATPTKETPRVAAPTAPNEPVRVITPPTFTTPRPQAPATMPPATMPPRTMAPHVDASPVDATPTGSINQVAGLQAPEAIGVIKSLAERGEPSAQFELGVRYADGRGVVRDAKTAAQWFEKAAAKGLAPAQYRLGSLYEKGIGVERDYARARKWYQSAADAGNARAMHNLAVLLAEGGDGGKPDYPAASEWFRKAADYGVRDSQFNLAILYARGLGVTQSLTQSYLWFSAAADQGDADAAKKRDEVGARLDTKDLAAAKTLATSFQARAPMREANDVLPPKGGWEAVKDPNAGAPRSSAKPSQKAKLSAL
ncbi:MAG: peptidoglycan-binding protein [Methylocystis sp.]|nr:MAG: peptidoglycan-binding protein [Methylocystis sp.]